MAIWGLICSRLNGSVRPFNFRRPRQGIKISATFNLSTNQYVNCQRIATAAQCYRSIRTISAERLEMKIVASTNLEFVGAAVA